MDYIQARALLLSLVEPNGTEHIPLETCAGRILAEDLTAKETVPPFDRSPYDGYAVRSSDTQAASKDSPVTLRVVETLAAGSVPRRAVEQGEAARIMTGAPIPEGCDAVVMFEKTKEGESSVTLFGPLAAGENVVRAGEDVKVGQLLAPCGAVIDAGLAATLAAQNAAEPTVFLKPSVGIISTGSELAEVGGPLPPGKIRNTNRYSLAAALSADGCDPVYLGSSGDDADAIAGLICEGLERCAALLLTGGVSVGDFDLTPKAMEKAGCEIIIRGIDMKPGMACCYGVKDGRLVCGLSGNPAASLTNYHAVLRPALRRLAGIIPELLPEIPCVLTDGFPKKSKVDRFLRGKLDLSDGTAVIRVPSGQGNAVISSAIGCDVLARIPAGSDPVPAGTIVKGIRI